MRVRTKTVAALAAIGALGVATVGFAATSSGQTTGSRLDDGKDLLPQAKITEQQAIRSALTAASGALNEVDLEHEHGKLVWNVDVGAKDVRVDAANGDVAGVTADD
jgi:uncharacterized membrane protein YkoI